MKITPENLMHFLDSEIIVSKEYMYSIMHLINKPLVQYSAAEFVDMKPDYLDNIIEQDIFAFVFTELSDLNLINRTHFAQRVKSLSERENRTYGIFVIIPEDNIELSAYCSDLTGRINHLDGKLEGRIPYV